MSWKAIHRWLGLTLGTLAAVLGITFIVIFDAIFAVIFNLFDL